MNRRLFLTCLVASILLVSRPISAVPHDGLASMVDSAYDPTEMLVSQEAAQAVEDVQAVQEQEEELLEVPQQVPSQDTMPQLAEAPSSEDEIMEEAVQQQQQPEEEQRPEQALAEQSQNEEEADNPFDEDNVAETHEPAVVYEGNDKGAETQAEDEEIEETDAELKAQVQATDAVEPADEKPEVTEEQEQQPPAATLAPEQVGSPQEPVKAEPKKEKKPELQFTIKKDKLNYYWTRREFSVWDNGNNNKFTYRLETALGYRHWLTLKPAAKRRGSMYSLSPCAMPILGKLCANTTDNLGIAKSTSLRPFWWYSGQVTFPVHTFNNVTGKMEETGKMATAKLSRRKFKWPVKIMDIKINDQQEYVAIRWPITHGTRIFTKDEFESNTPTLMKDWVVKFSRTNRYIRKVLIGTKKTWTARIKAEEFPFNLALLVFGALER